MTQATTALASLAELAGQYDTDGIDIYFLNDQRVMTNTKASLAEFYILPDDLLNSCTSLECSRSQGAVYQCRTNGNNPYRLETRRSVTGLSLPN
jgi:hypothetical protein